MSLYEIIVARAAYYTGLQTANTVIDAPNAIGIDRTKILLLIALGAVAVFAISRRRK